MQGNNIGNITRKFNVTVLSIPIVYDFFGNFDPNGLMYILSEDRHRVRDKALNNFKNKDENGDPFPIPTDEVQPLTIRANVGDRIIINFKHNEDRRLSIHIQGLKYENITSDGSNVGFNEDSTVGPGQKIIYEWYADKEGIFYFSDMGDTRTGEEGSNIHGLFGALIVQAEGSTWTDPVDESEIRSGLFADIHNPLKPSFREYAVYFHNELEIKNRFGRLIIDSNTKQPIGLNTISYRSESIVNRADFIPRDYVADTSKFRFIYGAISETRIFYPNKHQQRLEVEDLNSIIIDSKSVNHQEGNNIDILQSIGSLNKSIGDNILNCNLYLNFNEGVWPLFRAFDILKREMDVILQNEEVIPSLYIDETYKKAINTLPDRIISPSKDLLNPEYHSFINEKFKERPEQLPLGILNQESENKICPTDLEIESFTKGALYEQPCIYEKNNCEYRGLGECQNPDVTFELFALQAKLVCNNAGWNDPYGRFYVTKEQIEEYTGDKVTIENREKLVMQYVEGIENGNIDVEPLVIRANDNDCIEIRFTNFLPETLPSTAFQLETITDNISFHTHLVKFDAIDSDLDENEYNIISSVLYGETLVERYYVNKELNTRFLQDHINSNTHQQYGLFGVLIIEPKGATYYDPKTGKAIKYGTKAIIKTPSGRVFREFGLFIHDFALLFDRDNKALNPPPFVGSYDDPVVMGINYKCEPLRERLNDKYDDFSDVFNSKVHSDPVTPLLETYPGDEIVIRLLEGEQEEQHAFSIHGIKCRKEITYEKSSVVKTQTLGISQVFNIKIDDDYNAGDYIYYFAGQDDLWLGLWGIIRAYKNKTDRLLPIDSSKFNEKEDKEIDISKKKVREFHIAAIQKDIIYNNFKDHDPDGLLFVPYEYKDDVINGNIDPIPLILRANKGEYIKVTLTNCFTKTIEYQDFPGVSVDKVVTPSMRVGISTQFLKFNPVTDSGINIGYNDVEQTVAPGESITYVWYADEEYGTCLLSSFTDIRNHRYHGLFGAIIIEPEGSEIFSFGDDGDEYKYREQLTVYVDEKTRFKEFVIFMQNGIRLLDINGNLIETNQEVKEGEVAELVDFEYRGEKGFNYRSERFFNRLQEDPDISKVFSSQVHGDPSTPVFEAISGEKVIIRLIVIADTSRNTCLIIHGHEWKVQPDYTFRNIVLDQGGMNLGNVFNIELLNGASMTPGDYLYRSDIIKCDIESGMWGIIRVKKSRGVFI